MIKLTHPIPKVGDTLVLNDEGLGQCFGTTRGLEHMKTLRMKITYVDDTSITHPEEVFAVEVDNPEINDFVLNHWMFDIAVHHDQLVEEAYPEYVSICKNVGREPIDLNMWRSMSQVGREGFLSTLIAELEAANKVSFSPRGRKAEDVYLPPERPEPSVADRLGTW